MTSNYNFLEGQIPQFIDIDSDFEIIYNGAKSSFFAADISYTLQSFIEKIQKDLSLTDKIILKDDYYISYSRMLELFPKLTPDQKAIRVPVIPSGTPTADNPETGLIHYNVETNQFEGYSSGSWQGLGGVINIDQTAKVTADQENQLKFYTSNSQRMIIDASGNVGIGITDPSEALDVSGTIISRGKIGIGTTNPQYKLHIYATGIRPDYNAEILQQVGSNKMAIFTSDSYTAIRPENMTSDKLLMIGNGTLVHGVNYKYSWDKVIFDSPTHVGIGTTNPGDYKLNVNGNVKADKFVGELESTIVDINGGAIDGTSIGATTASSGNFTTLSTSGNVGIGTTNPGNYKLDVNGDIRIPQRYAHDGASNKLLFYSNPGFGLAGINYVGGPEYNEGPGSYLNFFTSDTSRMVIQRGGNVGIGTTNPSAKLHIYQSDNSKNALNVIKNVNGGGDGVYAAKIVSVEAGNTMESGVLFAQKGGESLTNNSTLLFEAYSTPSGGSKTSRMVVTGAGNVGIGTTNPRYPLEVNGGEDKHSTGAYAYTFYNLGTHVFNSTTTSRAISIYANKSIWSAVMVMASSDERIKSNIQDIQDDAALQTLRSIQPKTYNYKDVVSRGNSTVYGFIAQQIKEVLPDAVSLESTSIPNIYENTEVSTVNGIYNTISFTNFDTADLDASSNTIVVKDLQNKDHTVQISEIIDNKTIRVDTDLSEWMGAVDASNGTIIANEVQTYEKVILDASNNVVLENYDVSQIATLDASENVVGKMANLTDGNTIDSSNNYVDASGNFIAGPINTDGHYIDASGNYFDMDGNFMDASNNLIGTYKAEWKNVIVHGTTIFVYGQNVNDFHTLNKSAIWTVATAALQEVDRQLQAEKAKVARLEAKTVTLESQMADLLARVTALEST